MPQQPQHAHGVTGTHSALHTHELRSMFTQVDHGSGRMHKVQEPHGPSGLAQDDPREAQPHIPDGSGSFEHHRDSTRNTPRKEKQERNCGRKRGTEIVGLHWDHPHQGGPTLFPQNRSSSRTPLPLLGPPLPRTCSRTHPWTPSCLHRQPHTHDPHHLMGAHGKNGLSNVVHVLLWFSNPRKFFDPRGQGCASPICATFASDHRDRRQPPHTPGFPGRFRFLLPPFEKQ